MSLSEPSTTSAAAGESGLDVLCFSHLRWRFVYQRPQHLMSRLAARTHHVYYVEESVTEDVDAPVLRITHEQQKLDTLTPVLPRDITPERALAAQRALLDAFLQEHGIRDYIAWYYTPMALAFSDHLHPRVTVYDCMDELSAFRGAPPNLVEQEQQLLRRANVVFTGGLSLYEAKRDKHANIHPFPSSVDVAHFGVAREQSGEPEPADQAHIPHPRIGFFGVLDERLDRELLRDVAALEPAWQFILIGPVVKIEPQDLPRASNLHYLGSKQHNELPQYLRLWDVAMLPFILNESTRFISPTKTPEYLAAGKPVVSTPIHDVVEAYGKPGLAQIAANAEEFREAIAQSLRPIDAEWRGKVDALLADMSWDKTFDEMWQLVNAGVIRENK